VNSQAWVKLFFEKSNLVINTSATLPFEQVKTAGTQAKSRDEVDEKYLDSKSKFGASFPNYLTSKRGKRYPIGMVCDSPRVLHVMDVLSPKECDAIVEAARPSLTPSTVVSNNVANATVSADVRSSYGTYFPRGANPVVKVIEERIADLFGFATTHAEPIQILNYAPNAEYKPHHDYFDENTAEGKRLVAKSGNRVATLIMYLNEVELGGATIFPELNLQVLPRKGSLLYFDYYLPDGLGGGSYDASSLHGGQPVLAGEKWIATQWVRHLPYIG
jgi:prolyl 4-hydroxylase